MIKVSNALTVYEVDGRDVPLGEKTPSINISAHWNRRALVVVEIDGKKYSVIAEDIEAAVRNATNTGAL
jgi:hypothetical protein